MPGRTGEPAARRSARMARKARRPSRWVSTIFGAMLLATILPALAASPSRAHGLWLWKGPTILATPQAAHQLVDFCRSQGINEVYVSVLDHGSFSDPDVVANLIGLLHGSGVRIEALLSSADADEPGKHRETLLAHVRSIVQFNQSHPRSRFDGVHLDVEPQQRAENKGPGNLRFLPGLVEAFRAARALTEPAGLSITADIQNKLLKGSPEQRRALLLSLPRLTLMLYELEGNGAAEPPADTLRAASRKYLQMAYSGLQDPGLANLVIGLRTPDYGAQLPQMLALLDDANGADPHYAGWARHSYNDVFAAP